MVDVVVLREDILVYGSVADVFKWLEENAVYGPWAGAKVVNIIAFPTPGPEEPEDYILIHLKR